MNRQAHEQARRAAEAREDAEMGVAPGKGGSDLHEIIRGALEAFGRPLAARLKKMEGDFAGYVGERFGQLGAELRRELDNELSAAVRDVREVHADQNRISERLAQKAADRAVAELRVELRELRKELAELRAEKSNLRVLR